MKCNASQSLDFPMFAQYFKSFAKPEIGQKKLTPDTIRLPNLVVCLFVMFTLGPFQSFSDILKFARKNKTVFFARACKVFRFLEQLFCSCSWKFVSWPVKLL